jgi:hypothetical protein
MTHTKNNSASNRWRQESPKVITQMMRISKSDKDFKRIVIYFTEIRNTMIFQRILLKFKAILTAGKIQRGI